MRPRGAFPVADEVRHVRLRRLVKDPEVVRKLELRQDGDVPAEVLHQYTLQRPHHAQVEQVNLQELLHAVLDVQEEKVGDAEQLDHRSSSLARPTHVPQPFPAAAVVREVEHEVDVRVHLRHDEVVAVEQLREPRGGYVSGDRPVEGGHTSGMERDQLAGGLFLGQQLRRGHQPGQRARRVHRGAYHNLRGREVVQDEPMTRTDGDLNRHRAFANRESLRERDVAKVRLRRSGKLVAGHEHGVLDEVQDHLPQRGEPAHGVPADQVGLDGLQELLLREHGDESGDDGAAGRPGDNLG